METPEIAVQDVKQQIQIIKGKKSPGPYIFKILGTYEHCMQVLTCALNKIMKQEELMGTIQNSYGTNTKKATIRDLRPIALTNATFKLFMDILKTKVEHHISQI